MFKIVISKSAAKDLNSIPDAQIPGIVEAIDSLANNPRPSGCKKLKGSKEEFWRIRQGNYRVIYQISDSIQVIDIRRIGHRKDVYQ